MEMDTFVDNFLNLPLNEVDAATVAAESPLATAAAAAGNSFEKSSQTKDSSHLTDLLSMPIDDAAELEWLSRYMDDSFTDMPSDSTDFQLGNTTGRVRSKRSRMSEGGAANRKECFGIEIARKCTHCASEKTPQWRSGPLGPKTLCNACGVRYKSGRLVPEYRPAASPTFVLTQHSNSHRKVLELRRQKEMLQQ
ncbi:GATA transcription factor 4 [Andrographis paniculata]|uniref:GATA transcription factor 4 n=1 Tax=Andrographis paniculata TaxID=175694 RepID=UPI0021E91675|nr:GATA transcription factor 4 [Andrographis paniculata]